MSKDSEMSPAEITQWIKAQAQELGFLHVGITKAEQLLTEADRLQEWLNKGFHGEMSYMENHFEKRTDPTKLVEGARSIICFSYNYFPEATQNEGAPKIAKYAYGRDYHKVIKKKLITLYKSLDAKYGPIDGRCFVDSAPVMEREWALRAGLGWVGKNTLVIHPREGSFFFLAEMIIDLELVYDQSISDHCGTCTRCIDACPTDAISENGYELDASKCISYATIEYKGEELPESFEGKMEDWIFGCDICQDVCPWNKFSKPHTEPDFLPRGNLLEVTREEWNDLDQEKFDTLFLGTPVKRTGYEGLKRNIDFLKK